MSQLRKLATPFPAHLVESKPGKFAAAYVAHHVVEQALIATLRTIPRQEVREVIREADGTVTGCVLRMSCVIDGQEVVVEEAGDVENPQNKGTNGARLKDATSDAYKRCAMRMSLGLHLWAQEHYFLDKSLDKADGEAA